MYGLDATCKFYSGLVCYRERTTLPQTVTSVGFRQKLRSGRLKDRPCDLLRRTGVFCPRHPTPPKEIGFSAAETVHRHGHQPEISRTLHSVVQNKPQPSVSMLSIQAFIEEMTGVFIHGVQLFEGFSGCRAQERRWL